VFLSLLNGRDDTRYDILDKYGVVEYVDGLAPGVFVIVKGQNDGARHELS
jgi:predicted homoserine dehydrogenase-like protein